MTGDAMKERLMRFAINVGILTEKLPTRKVNFVYVNQVIRSSSSSGANYRAARRAKSKADHINKLKIVEEELDESIYFLELIRVFNKEFEQEILLLEKENDELLRIIVASLVTLRNGHQ